MSHQLGKTGYMKHWETKKTILGIPKYKYCLSEKCLRAAGMSPNSSVGAFKDVSSFYCPDCGYALKTKRKKS